MSTGNEIKVIHSKPIMAKTDINGVLEYANEYFVELSGYKDENIIGENISIIKHPHMPKLIFQLIWEKLLNKKKTIAIVKNLTKAGDYYWLQIKFDFKVNEETREIQNFYAYYSVPTNEAIVELDKLYIKLSKMEEHSGLEVSKHYLKGYLEEKNIGYENYIENLFQN
jgi:PAS domain S-box-containing protein